MSFKLFKVGDTVIDLLSKREAEVLAVSYQPHPLNGQYIKVRYLNGVIQTLPVSRFAHNPGEVPKPKGHPHARSMAKYAEDAANHPRPWELWETRMTRAGAAWKPLECTPHWNEDQAYRRRPPKPASVFLFGYEAHHYGETIKCFGGGATEEEAAIVRSEALKAWPNGAFGEIKEYVLKED